MDRFEELKNKYRSVLELIKAKGVKLAHLHVQDNKLFMQGAAPSEAIKNLVWDQIKVVDSGYSDLTCDLTVDASLLPPKREYTVKAGDSLWKIAKEYYGNGAEFQKIIAGNPGKLKDEKSVIHPGDVLTIPE